ncbi:MAG TPA: flagellar basal body rod protein FlgB [Syntrophomonas sp.]|nr:flagellar basal body rod protein FlgB [Syntrophomonas sp.]
MLDKLLNSGTQMLLQKSLDVASLRNEVLADNIANVNTPGFKRKEVIFEDKIRNAMAGNNSKLNLTDDRHIQAQDNNAQLEPEIKKMDDLSYRNDENNVDIDVESAKMAKNIVLYDFLGQSMSNELKLLRIAITGRR